MKILIAHSEITKYSGSGRYFYDIALGLAERGFSVTLLGFEIDDLLDKVSNIEIIRIKRPNQLPILWRFHYLIELLHIASQLRQMPSVKNFDVMIASDLLFSKVLIDFYGRDRKFIYTPLSMIAPLEIESYGFTGIHRKFSVSFFGYLQRWALLRCDRVVRFTLSALKALEQFYRIPLKQKAIIGVFVSRDFDDKSHNLNMYELFKKKKSNDILWVGRLIKSKNVDFLIRSVSKLKSQQWILNICSDGPEKESLKKLSQDLGIADRVYFLGFVENLSEIYLKSSIFVTASLLEQYSLTLMEAYQYGLPIIGLKPDWKRIFNSNEDQIIDGVTGFIISNEEEMAEKIDFLLKNEKKRIEMGIKGFLFKQQNYSFEKYLDKLINFCILG